MQRASFTSPASSMSRCFLTAIYDSYVSHWATTLSEWLDPSEWTSPHLLHRQSEIPRLMGWAGEEAGWPGDTHCGNQHLLSVYVQAALSEPASTLGTLGVYTETTVDFWSVFVTMCTIGPRVFQTERNNNTFCQKLFSFLNFSSSKTWEQKRKRHQGLGESAHLLCCLFFCAVLGVASARQPYQRLSDTWAKGLHVHGVIPHTLSLSCKIDTSVCFRYVMVVGIAM